MREKIDDPLPFRVLTLLALIAGYLLIYRPAEAHLALLQTATEQLSERIAFGEALINRRAEYQRAADRMRRELSGITIATNEAALTASFLEDVASKTRDEHVSLAEISPKHEAAAEGSILTMRVNGAYKPVISFLNDINAMHTVVRIDALRITRNSDAMRAGQTPQVEATIDASLLPLHAGITGSS
jgi:Tfp pilus assembly protein PilO